VLRLLQEALPLREDELGQAMRVPDRTTNYRQHVPVMILPQTAALRGGEFREELNPPSRRREKNNGAVRPTLAADVPATTGRSTAADRREGMRKPCDADFEAIEWRNVIFLRDETYRKLARPEGVREQVNVLHFDARGEQLKLLRVTAISSISRISSASSRRVNWASATGT
jgi:hypothetical protein